MTESTPLSGVVVVEIGHSVAVPYAGSVLAQLGATVIKVEKPVSGDDARLWGPPFWEGSAATFQALNRDKFGITVDFKDPDQNAYLRQLIIEHADIVIQNLRPGLIEEYRLGASLREQARHLIYCNLGAFGAVGPLRERPGYDPLMQAFGGIMSVTGEEGREPVRVGPSIIDMASGMWAVIGILAALRSRQMNGEGCEVDTSLYETALAWMTIPAAFYLSSGYVHERTGSEAPMLCPYKAFQAADGHLVIAAGNNNIFRRLCEAVGRKEWVDDPKFCTNADRIKHRKEMNALLQDLIAERPVAVWVDIFDKAEVPCAPLQSIDQVLAHEQTSALGMVQQAPAGPLRIMGLPISFNKERPRFRSVPPELGEHNGAIEAYLAGVSSATQGEADAPSGAEPPAANRQI